MLETLRYLWIWIKDKWAGRPTVSDRDEPRSNHWPTIRRHHLAREPRCQWCGGKSTLEVHHMVPFHIDHTKELDDANLITLCERAGRECHLVHGHLGNWKTFNPDIRKQCDERQKKEE